MVKKADIKAGRDYYIVVGKEYADGRPNVEKTVALADWTSYNKTYYAVTVEQIAAKDMGDTLYAQVFNADGSPAGAKFTRSIREYVNAGWKTQSETARTMLVDMLNYGAAAQIKFKYNTADLANSLLTPEQAAYGTAADVTVSNNQIKGANVKGCNLTLENNIQMNMYFNGITAGQYAVVTFQGWKGDAKEFTYQYEDFYISGSLKGIKLNELVVDDGRQMVNCKIYNADGSLHGELTDSVESIAKRSIDAKSDPDLFRAIMKFIDSTYVYLSTK
jgi:hypothetical protein